LELLISPIQIADLAHHKSGIQISHLNSQKSLEADNGRAVRSLLVAGI